MAYTSFKHEILPYEGSKMLGSLARLLGFRAKASHEKDFLHWEICKNNSPDDAGSKTIFKSLLHSIFLPLKF